MVLESDHLRPVMSEDILLVLIGGEPGSGKEYCGLN
jgi:hypothetical protein